MPKRPDTRETALLALELFKRAPRSGKVSPRELHEQLPTDLGRDFSTVQRQRDMLSQAFDIERNDTSKPFSQPQRVMKRANATMMQRAWIRLQIAGSLLRSVCYAVQLAFVQVVIRLMR